MYLFLIWTKQRKLPESDMERRTGKSPYIVAPVLAQIDRNKKTQPEPTIFLFDHNHINRSAQGSWIDRIPCLRDGTTDTPHVLHPARIRKVKEIRILCSREASEICKGATTTVTRKMKEKKDRENVQSEGSRSEKNRPPT